MCFYYRKYISNDLFLLKIVNSILRIGGSVLKNFLILIDLHQFQTINLTLVYCFLPTHNDLGSKSSRDSGDFRYFDTRNVVTFRSVHLAVEFFLNKIR